MSPNIEPPSPSDSGIRKRVCKACDRCRLKKSKCDGANPCSRCKTDNAICFFGERKKSHDKVYPKGYVEMLESQQAQLVTGLQELYKRVQTGSGWSGAPLKDSLNGNPLTHDILERLGALKQEGSTNEHFEENLEALQQKLMTSGATPMHRTSSLELSVESAATSPISDGFTNHGSFGTSFANKHFPPTPPSHSPHPMPSHHTGVMEQAFFDPSHMDPFSAFPPGFLDNDQVEQLMTCKSGGEFTMEPMMFSSPGLASQGVINPFQTLKNWDPMTDMRQYQSHTMT